MHRRGQWEAGGCWRWPPPGLCAQRGCGREQWDLGVEKPTAPTFPSRLASENRPLPWKVANLTTCQGRDRSSRLPCATPSGTNGGAHCCLSSRAFFRKLRGHSDSRSNHVCSRHTVRPAPRHSLRGRSGLPMACDTWHGKAHRDAWWTRPSSLWQLLSACRKMRGVLLKRWTRSRA